VGQHRDYAGSSGAARGQFTRKSHGYLHRENDAVSSKIHRKTLMVKNDCVALWYLRVTEFSTSYGFWHFFYAKSDDFLQISAPSEELGTLKVLT